MASANSAPSARPSSHPPRSSTRYRTASNPPRQFAAVEAALIAGNGERGYKDRKEMISTIRSAAPGVYGEDSSASEVVRFLEHYEVITKPSGRLVVDSRRLRRVREACEQQEDLPLEFVLDAPVPLNGSGKPVNRTVLQPKRSAYLTQEELEALTIIDAGLEETVVGGEFRVPSHSDPEVFAKSDIGQLFGKHHEVFSRLLARFVGGGILRKVPHTGPGGNYDAYAFVVPLKEIRVFLIDERVPTAVPSFVLDIISRVLDLEGIEFVQGESATTTIRRAAITRLTNRGVRAVEGIVDTFHPWMCQHNQVNPVEGWGLVLQMSPGAEVLVCFPGFGPVQYVEDSTFMRKQMVVVPAEPKLAPKVEPQPVVPPAPPRLITVAEVGEGMDDATLDRILAEYPALLEAAKAEKECRLEAARLAVELAAREARRSELEQKRATATAEAARKAAEAQAAAAALAAIEAELAAV